MKQDEKNNLHYVAGDGKTFVQKTTGVRFGNDLYLSSDDSIDNYEEVEMTMAVTPYPKTYIEHGADIRKKEEEKKVKKGHKNKP